ncbi:hypothetical protein MJ572_03300 [Escherichia coli]|nr:hypothetical protein MJ572_03300 [Escherichia coli]
MLIYLCPRCWWLHSLTGDINPRCAFGLFVLFLSGYSWRLIGVAVVLASGVHSDSVVLPDA